jgi:hypothetical protein
MKNIGFLVDEEFHKEIKLQSTKEGKGIKEYIIRLIEEDLKKKKEQPNA